MNNLSDMICNLSAADARECTAIFGYKTVSFYYEKKETIYKNVIITFFFTIKRP